VVHSHAAMSERNVDHKMKRPRDRLIEAEINDRCIFSLNILLAALLTESQQLAITPKSAMSEDTRRMMLDALEERKRKTGRIREA
jgi:hypothetical protein